MKSITEEEVGAVLENALKNRKKNILFISYSLEYDYVLEWLDEKN